MNKVELVKSLKAGECLQINSTGWTHSAYCYGEKVRWDTAKAVIVELGLVNSGGKRLQYWRIPDAAKISGGAA